MTEATTATATDAPCQCMTNHAYIAPMHGGHCCFHPSWQNCHQAEFAAWVQRHRQRHPGWEPDTPTPPA